MEKRRYAIIGLFSKPHQWRPMTMLIVGGVVGVAGAVAKETCCIASYSLYMVLSMGL